MASAQNTPTFGAEPLAQVARRGSVRLLTLAGQLAILSDLAEAPDCIVPVPAEPREFVVHLSKPVTINTLLTSVERVLRSERQGAE